MLVNVEAERVRSQLTKSELASKLNISVTTYNNWIHERTDIPGSGLLKMSTLFGKDIDYLLVGAKGTENSE